MSFAYQTKEIASEIAISCLNSKVIFSLLDEFTIFIPFNLLLFKREHRIRFLCLFEKSHLSFCLSNNIIAG